MKARPFLLLTAIIGAALLPACEKDSPPESGLLEEKVSSLKSEVSSLRSKIESLENTLREVEDSVRRGRNADDSARHEVSLLKEEIQSLLKQLAGPLKQWSHVKVGELPFGMPVTGKPGKVKSPYAPEKGQIDVDGYSRGTMMECPFSGMLFRVP